jgi:hypothetical protein
MNKLLDDYQLGNAANIPEFEAAPRPSLSSQVYPSILTLKTPNVEEIARAIWQRQHDALNSHAASYNATWRDQSIPSRFWDEFMLDAQAVLLLLYNNHIEYQNTRV